MDAQQGEHVAGADELDLGERECRTPERVARHARQRRPGAEVERLLRIRRALREPPGGLRHQ